MSGGVRASTRVFSTMTNRVLHAPMSYFDTTPMGRILNRFTYDVEQVDITLAQYMSIFVIGKLLLRMFVALEETKAELLFPISLANSLQTIISQFSICSLLLVSCQPSCDHNNRPVAVHSQL